MISSFFRTSFGSLRARTAEHPRLARCAVGLAIAALCSVGASGGAFAAQPTEFAKGRVVVHARAGLSDAEVAKIAAPHGGKARRIGNSDLFIIDLPANASETAVANLLARHPHLKFAELDAIIKPAYVSNDPYLGSEWHISKIGASTAWDSTQGAGVTIAIVDSGVDATHPDLAANIVAGWNFYDNNSNTADVTGHGTAVAGTAAAVSNNGAGVAGVAGAAKIMPLRVSDTGGGATGSAIAQALTYAADHGVRVANVSFAGVPGNTTIESAAQYMKGKGGLVVVAAGNNGINENITPTTTMIPVSSTESTDLLSTFSSYGSYVAVSAPGDYIWTTTRGGGYGQWWGTSFASPVAAGVVALMMSARPDLPNTQIESLLYSSATDLGAVGRDIYYGYGRVNASAGVAAAKASAAVDTQAPSSSISAPLAGATVSGLVPVNVSATDNVGVTRVDLQVNGKTVASDTVSPYAFSWDSTTVANGTASLVAVAYDAAGNSKASTSVSVSVANAVVVDTTPPTVAIYNPANGSKVSGTVNVSASASDNSGSGGIKQSIYLDGRLVASGTGGTLSWSWNTRKATAGSHTIQAVAQDAAGNKSTSSVLVSY
jgi:subtilisin family serine protease